MVFDVFHGEVDPGEIQTSQAPGDSSKPGYNDFPITSYFKLEKETITVMYYFKQRIFLEAMETETTGRRVWATMLYDRLCLPGLLVLDYCLRKQGNIIEVLGAADISVEFVDTIVANNGGKIYTGKWQKLSAWNLTSYKRIVLVDTNQLVFNNIHDLQSMIYGHPGYIAAVPAAPLLPTTGTIILQPSKDGYNHPQTTLNDYFMADEQGVLALSYGRAQVPLPYTYSAVESVKNTYGRPWEELDVKVRCYDLGRPWERTQRTRDGGTPVKDWLDAWAKLRGEWDPRDGVWCDPDRRRLWRSVLGPIVGGGEE
ncbi:hypothetical protein B0I37DRAFT_352246 [Chaetomium sp. MPI-CAGE-AT-0009]|nr:hypothetical protein B0I37DRAFT_352246 [Chaetomium sp. MPI-CAGE-AT-0009]